MRGVRSDSLYGNEGNDSLRGGRGNEDWLEALSLL
jgi:hypothetical protein